ASRAISDRGRACSAARADTGRTESSAASASVGQPSRGRGPPQGSQTALSTRTNLKRCSCRTILGCGCNQSSRTFGQSANRALHPDQVRFRVRRLSASSSRRHPDPTACKLVRAKPNFDSTHVHQGDVLVGTAHTLVVPRLPPWGSPLLFATTLQPWATSVGLQANRPRSRLRGQ